MDNHLERSEAFRKKVNEIGGTIYTKRCLLDFCDYWCEPDRGKKIKLRWEKEKTFAIDYRLRTWASRCRDYNPHLTEGQKTIAEKRRAFAISLEPYLAEYGKDTLNSFFKYWCEPENKINPENLKFELQEFWELKTRLSTWAERNLNTVKR